jgi:curved DNA-binding protein CbpA
MKKKPDPYADLGVPKDADAPTIKRAYRRKAAQHHPDKGGTPEAFMAVQRAYDILSNDERRARYDQYGDTEPEDLDTEAHKTLIRTVKEMAAHLQDHKTENLIQLARGFIKDQIIKAQTQITAGKKRIKRWQDISGRTKAKSDNFLVAAFNAEIAQEEANVKNIELSIEVGRRMLKLLDNFEYTVDEKKPDAGVTIASLFGTPRPFYQ